MSTHIKFLNIIEFISEKVLFADIPSKLFPQVETQVNHRGGIVKPVGLHRCMLFRISHRAG